MTVSVASKMIQNRAGLTDLGRLALAFIDGGSEWLDWAISNAGPRYDFPDESTLVEQVQQGLHATRLALLPIMKLMVSPVKLMTLGVDSLRTLADAESGNASATVSAQVKRILADHNLLTQDDFAAGASFLDGLGVSGAPVFQFMGFDEQLAVQELLYRKESQGTANPELQKEAAAFAVDQARTVQEFADYYQFYLIYVNRLGALTATPDDRKKRAAGALETILPQLFGFLECPQVGPLAAPAEVARAVTNWQKRGRLVGFARLSDGALQVVRDTGFRDETGDAVRVLVTSYLAGAQALLSATPPQRGIMGQDGASCLFPVFGKGNQAEIQMGSAGVISLRCFRPDPPATTTIAATTAATAAA